MWKASEHKDYQKVCDLIDSIKTSEDFYNAMEKTRKYSCDLVNCIREDRNCWNSTQFPRT